MTSPPHLFSECYSGVSSALEVTPGHSNADYAIAAERYLVRQQYSPFGEDAPVICGGEGACGDEEQRSQETEAQAAQRQHYHTRQGLAFSHLYGPHAILRAQAEAQTPLQSISSHGTTKGCRSPGLLDGGLRGMSGNQRRPWTAQRLANLYFGGLI